MEMTNKEWHDWAIDKVIRWQAEWKTSLDDTDKEHAIELAYRYKQTCYEASIQDDLIKSRALLEEAQGMYVSAMSLVIDTAILGGPMDRD